MNCLSSVRELCRDDFAITTLSNLGKGTKTNQQAKSSTGIPKGCYAWYDGTVAPLVLPFLFKLSIGILIHDCFGGYN